MAKFFGLVALATTAFGAAAAGSNGSATVDNTCVIADFETATGDFIALNNVVNILKASPALLSSYIADPLILENEKLSVTDFSLLGMDFTIKPTIKSLNVTGITKLSPKPINVTSSNSIDLGTDFTGEVSVAGTFSVEISQLNYQWWEICWTDLWHTPGVCPSKTITVDVALALDKPSLVSNIEANLYQCAAGIPTSVCTNLTVTSILVAALGGDLTVVADKVLSHMKDASLNSLTLGWDSIKNIDFNFKDTGKFINKIINALLDFSADTLNKKGEIYKVFLEVVQKLLLSLLNNLIDEDLKPLFGATCL